MSDLPETDAAPSSAGAPSGSGTDPDEQVMDLLAEHVPLALLVDLLTPEGPASADILRTEGLPDDAWWESENDDAVSAEPRGGAPEPGGATPEPGGGAPEPGGGAPAPAP